MGRIGWLALGLCIAVLATSAGFAGAPRSAVGAGANTTFILAVQTLRLLVAVLLAPLAVRRIVRAGSRRA